MYDFIGDIHGHADELVSLLEKMDYTLKNGAYSHPERTAVFVGDYIDRGAKIEATLNIVRRMVDSDNAIALMGNHEYNALCFHFPEREGGHIRKHSIKNILQHFQTLAQFQNRQKDYEEWIDWCKSLPLFYETDQFRAVHACWDDANITYLRHKLKNDRLSDDLIYESAKKGTRLNLVIDQTLKGKEITMPNGGCFTDKDGTIRNEIRIKWWENPAYATYKQISVIPIDDLPETPITHGKTDLTMYYREDEKPVFFGHYWLTGQPTLYRENVCCLDYSVAKGGYLVAYRWDGESKLSGEQLIWV
ncbi:MAG TPA: metallophosphoesterase [Chitinophagaceae bacterium]|jgi:hypothetical protein|nr:metallophosphoesterase [Chitinophagaceae bacterium]